jgi:CheY-like chemotaxis protein
MRAPTSKTILVIDDCHDFRETMCDFLTDAGYFAFQARCADEAFALLKNEPVDAIACDLVMPFTYGKDFFKFPYSAEVGKRMIKELIWLYPFKPIIAVTALNRIDVVKIAREIQTVPILLKPFRPEELVSLIESSIAMHVSQVAQ